MSRRDIVVTEQREISIYVSDPGYICIKQIDWENKEHVVLIDAMHAKAISDAIMGAVSEAANAKKEWLEDENGNS